MWCYNCQIVCKDEHVSNDWSPYAKPQPDTGQFCVKVNEYVRGTVPKVKMSYIPVLCMHCDDAPCIQSCPIEGGIYKRDDGLVIIDPKNCTGCMNCIDSCPFGCIYFNESICIAQNVQVVLIY
jgi:Fe-S-cluster-containing dehydrogenase component